jgi:hypothetical protein
MTHPVRPRSEREFEEEIARIDAVIAGILEVAAQQKKWAAEGRADLNKARWSFWGKQASGVAVDSVDWVSPPLVGTLLVYSKDIVETMRYGNFNEFPDALRLIGRRTLASAADVFVHAGRAQSAMERRERREAYEHFVLALSALAQLNAGIIELLAELHRLNGRARPGAAHPLLGKLGTVHSLAARLYEVQKTIDEFREQEADLDVNLSSTQRVTLRSLARLKERKRRLLVERAESQRAAAAVPR